MSVPAVFDEDAILRAVREWPREQQVHLARLILDPGLATINPQTGLPYVMSSALRGIGAGGKKPPTDEEIERWRMEKYGE